MLSDYENETNDYDDRIGVIHPIKKSGGINEKIEKYKNTDMNTLRNIQWSYLDEPPIPLQMFSEFFNNGGRLKDNWKLFINTHESLFQIKYDEYLMSHPNEQTNKNHLQIFNRRQKEKEEYKKRQEQEIQQSYNTQKAFISQQTKSIHNSNFQANTTTLTEQMIHIMMTSYLSQDFANTIKQLTWSNTAPPLCIDYMDPHLNILLYRKKSDLTFAYNTPGNQVLINIITSQYSQQLWNKYKEYIYSHPQDHQNIHQILRQKLANFENGIPNQKNNISNIPPEIQILILQQKDQKQRDELYKFYNVIETLPNGPIKDQAKKQFVENLKKFDFKLFIEKYKLRLLILFICILFVFTFGENYKNMKYLLQTRNFNDLKKGLKDLLETKDLEKLPKFVKGSTPENEEIKIVPVIVKSITSNISFQSLTDPFRILDSIKNFLTSFGPTLKQVLTPINLRKQPVFNDTYWDKLNNFIKKLFNIIIKICDSSKEGTNTLIKRFKNIIVLFLKYLVNISKSQI